MLFIPTANIFYAMNFILGASCPLKAMIAYTHLMEWVPGKESLISGVIFCVDGFLFVLCPLILLYVTVDTQVFLWIGFAINIFAIIIFAIFFFPESPIFLLETNKFD